MAKAQPGTAVVDIQAELKKRAEAMSSRIQAPTGNFIRVTQDKQFEMPDKSTSSGPITAVILDFACVNSFFDTPFKAGEASAPACFATGPNAKGLVPVPESPVKQADACDECPNNEFGSKGAGKACSNTRLLALVMPDADPQSPIYMLKASATAIKAFDGFVASVKTQFDTVPVGIETEIYFDPTLKYGSLRFKPLGVNPNLAVHFNRLDEAAQLLKAVPDMSGYTPPKKTGRR